jgi:hypothetical protein
MTDQHGPPKEVEGRTPHHRGQPSTSRFSTHNSAYTHSQFTAEQPKTPGRALVWVPCAWRHPQDVPSQLRRRSAASKRLVPLDCGCSDTWTCSCSSPPLSEAMVDAGRDAALHILETGTCPVLEIEVLRALYRRGGQDRQLAERLHALTGGEVR